MGEAQIKTPHKKWRKQELTNEQKRENKEFSAQQIFVEHLIRLVKIFRVAQERLKGINHGFYQTRFRDELEGRIVALLDQLPSKAFKATLH